MHGVRLAVIALAVGLAACGGDDPEDFGEQVVEAFCEREARCGVYASADTCEESLRQRGWETWMGLGTRYEAALESGRLSFDEEAAERCLDAIRDRDCRLPALSEAAMSRGIEYDPSCQVLRAQRTEGACLAHAECGESGFCRYTEASGCQGTCTPRHGEGGPGEWPEHCAPGLVPGADGTCQRARGEGETCHEVGEDASRDPPCAAGLWCDRGSNTCRPTGAEGDACAFEQDRPCGASFICEAGRCERRPPEGRACTAPAAQSALQAHRCQRDLFCDADAEQPGTCRERREEGAACRNFSECATDLYCAGAEPESGTWGRCQKRPGAGEACELYFGTGPITNCLAGHHCSPETNRCVPWVREGERCGPEARCEQGVCSDEGRCTSPEAWTCR
ncbi:hypothetical protein [Pyxidicoccus trucidator]|uniref:hypothetical protein n=1 Tax=Pyxidicoccus trucidator TaxID=2709662 RepID=UPI0013DBD8D5|nr:hypothetical protein [Pyxidicoccus trucidator]